MRRLLSFLALLSIITLSLFSQELLVFHSGQRFLLHNDQTWEKLTDNDLLFSYNNNYILIQENGIWNNVELEGSNIHTNGELVLTSVNAPNFLKASPKDKIIVATDATWPPMEFMDNEKNIVGFDIDLIKEIGKAVGVNIEIKNTSWDGIFAELESGKYQAVVSGVTITDEKKSSMDFSNPYLNAGQVLVVKKVANVTKLEDLVGKKVGAQIGTTGAIAISKTPGLKLIPYDKIDMAFQNLANGNIQGVVVDLNIAVNFIFQNINYQNKFKIVGRPLTEEWLGIAIKKGDVKTLMLINNGLEKIKTSGKLDEIITKWHLNIDN